MDLQTDLRTIVEDVSLAWGLQRLKEEDKGCGSEKEILLVSSRENSLRDKKYHPFSVSFLL